MTTDKDCRSLIRERLDFAAAGQEGQPVDCGAWSRTTPTDAGERALYVRCNLHDAVSEEASLRLTESQL
jgi:hypothetical protein